MKCCFCVAISNPWYEIWIPCCYGRCNTNDARASRAARASLGRPGRVASGHEGLMRHELAEHVRHDLVGSSLYRQRRIVLAYLADCIGRAPEQSARGPPPCRPCRAWGYSIRTKLWAAMQASPCLGPDLSICCMRVHPTHARGHTRSPCAYATHLCVRVEDRCAMTTHMRVRVHHTLGPHTWFPCAHTTHVVRMHRTQAIRP